MKIYTSVFFNPSCYLLILVMAIFSGCVVPQEVDELLDKNPEMEGESAFATTLELLEINENTKHKQQPPPI